MSLAVCVSDNVLVCVLMRCSCGVELTALTAASVKSTSS